MSAGAWTRWQPAIDTGRHHRGEYAPIPPAASGIYAIRAKRGGQVLYVGMSWTGRLRKTAIRHFQRWKRDWMHEAERVVFDPVMVEIKWREVTGGRLAVLRAESEAIAELRPVHNIEVPAGSPADDEGEPDVAPF